MTLKPQIEVRHEGRAPQRAVEAERRSGRRSGSWSARSALAPQALEGSGQGGWLQGAARYASALGRWLAGARYSSGSSSVLEASLHRGDVSIVTYGASPSTSSTLRTAGSFTLEQRAVAVEMTRGVAVGRGPITAIGGVQQRAANQFGQHVECADCGGSGECPTCDGTGTVWQSNDDDRSEKRRDRTDKEVQELGRQGLALWVGDHYAWPIVDAVDLDAAVQSFGRAKSSAGSSAVKRWIILRARALRRLDLLPDTWGVKRSAVVLAPNDTFDLEREWEQLRLRRGRR